MRRVRIAKALVWLCNATAWAAVLAAPEASRAEGDTAGVYEAAPAIMVAEVSTWGTDCGVKPQSQTLPERGSVLVLEDGGQLELRFPTRTVRTNACWSENPAVKLANAARTGNQWNLRCSTPASDPKHETGLYSVVQSSPVALELREESEYVWQLKASRCVAKVRITQRLTRTAAPEAKLEPAPPEPAIPEVCVPGALSKLKLRPAEARIEPGQRVCFSARGMDAAGCAVALDDQAIAWTLEKAPALRASLMGNCFKAGDSTADAEGTFKVSASYQGVRSDALVTVAVPDLSDITAHRVGAGSSDLQGDDVTHGAGLAGAGVKAVAVEGPNYGVWALALAGLATGLGLSIWGFRRGKVEPSATLTQGARVKAAATEPTSAFVDHPPERAEAKQPNMAATPNPVAPTPGTEPLICPTCRRGYAPGNTRCSRDGTELLPYPTFVRQAKANATPKACPGCGHSLPAEAVFCGACGKRA